MKTIYVKSVLGLMMLFSTAACVMTPLGDVAVDGVVTVEPRVVYSSRSRVTIGIGPNYTIDDAFYLANNHCRGYGYYAVPSSTWAHTHHSPRNLVYHCRRTAPVVIHPGPSRPPRYHRPVPPPVVRPNPPRTGWWSRNRPAAPAVVAPPARHSERETRSTVTPSPWSYNPRKNDTPAPRVYAPRPTVSAPSVSAPPSRVQSSTAAPSKPSSSAVGSSSSNSSSNSPGWWGKNKKQ